MSDPVSVRFATLADLEFVQQDHYVSPEIIRRKIAWQEVIVAEQQGRLVGYLRLEYLWSSIPYIALIHVIPEARRQGIGQALLGYLEMYLRSKDYTAFYSSAQANEPEPQAWHRRVGFNECGIIAGINQGGIGELFFRKQL